MSSIIIAKMNNEKDADFLLQVIKRVQGEAKILKGKALEDFHFAQLIDEGMKSETIPLAKLRAKLRK
ncbi:MAG TPA: hypothetical protein VK808_13690 [Bacteroidia bacterium]|jgi:hypothetical protein|nr:hypothetical protein [Bacteroidia bacterium]